MVFIDISSLTYLTNQQSQATPLVFNFHRTSSAQAQMWYGDFRNIADTANFILVHPQGLLDNTGVTHWNIGHPRLMILVL